MGAQAFALAAALALAGLPVMAAETEKPADATAAKPAKPDPKTLRCVWETPTGSSITKRVCYTKEDWAELQRMAAESHAQGRDRSTFCASAGREC